MPFYSPLRYPGGKRRLIGAISALIEANEYNDVVYAEPFAGGAAVGIALLFEEYASTIHLNDLNKPIFAFWDAVLNDTDALCSKIRSAPLTMDEWHKQRAVYDSRNSADNNELGFATLFLNRTNRSGIVNGGVIGGKNQTGKWKIDARFNKNELIQRIEKIGRYRNRINLHQTDALEFSENVLMADSRTIFTFFDPPYIKNGNDLYLDNYREEDHRRLSSHIEKLNQPWVCTYDVAALDLGLFPYHRKIEYDLKYTTQGRYAGREVMFLSKNLDLPEAWLLSPDAFLLSSPNKDLKLYGVFRDVFLTSLIGTSVRCLG